MKKCNNCRNLKYKYHKVICGRKIVLSHHKHLAFRDHKEINKNGDCVSFEVIK